MKQYVRMYKCKPVCMYTTVRETEQQHELEVAVTPGTMEGKQLLL